MGEKLSSRCPNCGGNNLQTEPLYDYEDGLTDELALFCFSCGHYLGEMPSQLWQQMEVLRSNLSFLTETDYDKDGNPTTGADKNAVRDFLLGRRAASPDFD